MLSIDFLYVSCSMFGIVRVRLLLLLLFLLVLFPERHFITSSSRVSNYDGSVEEDLTSEHYHRAHDQRFDHPGQVIQGCCLVYDSRPLLLDHSTSTSLYKDIRPGRRGLCATNMPRKQAPQLLPRASTYSQEDFERDRSRRL